MAIGRFICVGIPLVLTMASLIALLVATLSSVTHNQLWMFRVDLNELNISPTDLHKLAGKSGIVVTSADLGLANIYEVDLWGYCSTYGTGRRQCTAASFNWANSELNTNYIKTVTGLSGVETFQPFSEIEDALSTFRTVSKWTQVAFIIALIALGLELLTAIFANLSRAFSCLTWLVAAITAILIGACASLSTAAASIIVGSLRVLKNSYGVKAVIGTRFFATVWLSTLFAFAAAFFWIFTICCCKPDHRRSGDKRHWDSDNEKLVPNSTAYRPLAYSYELTSGQNSSIRNPNQPQQIHNGYPSVPRHQLGQGRTDLAYEPYSHQAQTD